MEVEKFDDSLIEVPEAPRRGQILKGAVISITADGVYLDIQFKSEGMIPVSEFSEEELKSLEPGTELSAMVMGFDRDSGLVRLSREEAEKNLLIEEIASAARTGRPVDGVVTEKIKGGYLVLLQQKGVSAKLPAFLPASQVDLRRRQVDESSVLGRHMSFIVVEPGSKKRKPVVSRAAYIERNIKRRIEEFKELMGSDKTVKARVISIKDFGVFLESGGVEIFVKREELAWKRFDRVQQVIDFGEEYPVRLLDFDEEKRRFLGSIKQALPDPWEEFTKKYRKGDVVDGRVTGLTAFGAFVEVEEGIEGMIHVSELSWSRNIKKPSQVLKKGDRVSVKILKIEKEKRRISLSLRQTLENPWEEFLKKNPPGTRVRGRVTYVTSSRVFVDLGDNIEGIVKKEDLSWDKRVPDPVELYKKGQEIECVVLRGEAENARIFLGIKQLTEDPWQKVNERFPVGSVVKGRVSDVRNYGVFVRLDEAMEGLLPRPEAMLPKDKKIEDVFSRGQDVEAIVTEIDPKKRRITLSIRQLEERRQKEELEKIMGTSKGLPKLGDVFGHILKGG